MKKYIFIILIIIISGGVWFSFSYRVDKGDLNDVDDPGGNEPLVEDQFRDINLTLYNQDRSVSWQLEAEEAASSSGEGLLKLNPVIIKAYNELGEDLYSLSARKGNYFSESNSIELKDSISLKKADLELKANTITWQGEDNPVNGSGGIRIRTALYLLSGDHFQSDPALNQLTVYGNEEEQASLSWVR